MTTHSENIQHLSQQFWDFSLALYGFGDVQRLVLVLQDEFGLNVNLLLLCGFLHSLNVSLSEQDARRLIQGIKASNIRIKALREKRRAAKAGPSEQYQALKLQELELEQHQQRNITEMVQSVIIMSSKKEYIVTQGLKNLRTYVSAELGSVTELTSRIEPLILDLNAQFGAFLQAKNNAK